MSLLKSFASLLFTLIISFPLWAGGPESVFEKLFRSGYQDEVTQGKLTHISAQGQSSVKEFELRLMEMSGGKGEKTLIRFTSPATIAGTTLLSHSLYDGESKQWFYLPAFKSVKEIAGVMQRGRFVGSEFTYEDLQPFRYQDYTITLVRTEPCGASSCAVFSAETLVKDSAYSKKLMWTRQDNGELVRVDLYDKKTELAKRVQFENYQTYQEKFLRPNKVTMTNLQTQAKSVLEFSHRKLGVGLKSQHFDPKSL